MLFRSGGAAAAPGTRPDGQMLPAGSALVIGELAVLPRSPPPPPLPPLLLPPEKISGPDPDRRCPGSRGGWLSTASSPEWLLPPATPAAPTFDCAGDLADPEEEEEEVVMLARARSGDTGDPRSANTLALESGLSRTAPPSSAIAAARRRNRSASDMAGSHRKISPIPPPAPRNSSSSPDQTSRHRRKHATREELVLARARGGGGCAVLLGKNPEQ